jgi:hypothetical protein
MESSSCFLEKGTTINSEWYIETLHKLQAAFIPGICSGTHSQYILLQHDNARPHASCQATEEIVRLEWTVLQHPPYS